MTFLEWEIYYLYELEEAVEVVKRLQQTAKGILPQEQLDALQTVLDVAVHVVERGHLDEETNKWKID